MDILMELELRQRNIANTVNAEGAEPFAPSPQLNVGRSSNCCIRMACGTANCVKKFGLGVAAAGIVTPVSGGVVFLARKLGLIQELGESLSLTREGVANLAKTGIALDADALANAVCPMQEYVSQLNHALQLYPEYQQTVFSVKASLVTVIGIVAPIFEEVVFRCLIQNVLLKDVPKFIVKHIAPGRETALDSNIATLARVALTAALFSAYHLTNSGLMADSIVSTQIVATLVMGIGFGALKESNAGLLGAIGAHVTNNILAISPQLWSC